MDAADVLDVLEARGLIVSDDVRQRVRWAAQPVEFGLCSVFRPLVLGPDEIPIVTDPEQADQAPYLALLSAVAHGRDKDIDKAVQVAQTAHKPHSQCVA